MQVSLSYIMINFTPVVTIAFLIVFMRTNDMFEKKVSDLFNLAVVFTVAMIVVGNIRLETGNKVVWLINLGLAVKTFVLWSITLIMMRRILFKYKPYVVIIPAVLSAVFALIGSIMGNDQSKIIGRLEWLYILGMLAVVGFNIYTQIYDEALIGAAIAVMMGFAMRYDAGNGNWYNLFWTADVLSLAFFYMYFHAQSFKRDVLTGVLNRRCFYADAKRFELRISAIMSIDLNNLKTLNDTMGHAEGDKAIVTMTNCVRRALPRDCYMYRTGGDEFMAIFTKTDLETVRITKDVVKDNMAKTPYSCAIGIAQWGENDNLDEVCARADVAMYEDKIQMKKIIGGAVR